MIHPLDFSDFIAAVECSFYSLQELDPEGDWIDNKLLNKWLRDRYTLTASQYKKLIKELTEAQTNAHVRIASERFTQMNLFG